MPVPASVITNFLAFSAEFNIEVNNFMPVEATPMLQFLLHKTNNNYNLTDTQNFLFVTTLAHLTPLVPELFFLILAQPVYKM